MPREIRSIEELRSLEGQEVGLSEWIAVDQAKIDSFAELTGDDQWIHVDTERAQQESPYRKTIAHGFLTLSLVSTLARQAFTLSLGFQRMINYGLNRVRFPAPVLSGSRVRARFRLQNVDEIPRGLQITWAVTVECEGNEKPCLVAEWLLRGYG